jgi:hypothetical protein
MKRQAARQEHANGTATGEEDGARDKRVLKRARVVPIVDGEEEEVGGSQYSESEQRLLARVAQLEAQGEGQDDESDTEFIRREREKQRHYKTEAEVGVIEKIKLENFMCHRHLELKLGPNINFIIGQNGSTSRSMRINVFDR